MPAKKIALVTGGNSGLGYECCLALAKLPDMHVILAGRDKSRVHDAVAKVTYAASPSSIVEAGIVDLGSLASVRQFAETLAARKLHLYTLVCNAGVQMVGKEFTVDGFEKTIGINHIGHFLLVHLLREHTDRILVVSSGTHDPAEKTGVPAPNVANLEQLARGLDAFDGMEAYSSSKLLNLVFTNEFARRYPNGPTIYAYTPGLTPDTGLFRDRHWLVLLALMPLFRLASWWGGSPVTTSAYTGGYMAKIASNDPSIPVYPNGTYVRIDEAWEPSALAKDTELGKELWKKSEVWVGLK